MSVKALHFADEAALLVALRAQLVPAEVAAAPASVWRAGQALYVAPSVKLSRAQWSTLAQAGAPQAAPDGEPADASCWAELIRPRAVGEPHELDRALFWVPDESSLLELAGEMLRLGCDRQQLRATAERFWLRVVAPPYYTVTRALDGVGGLRAFSTVAGGNERVWSELGWEHPLASSLRPVDGSALYIGSDGRFTYVPDQGEGWIDVQERIDLVLPSPAPAPTPQPLTQKLSVPLKLARAGRTDPPSLWVVRQDVEAQIDALVTSLPDDVLQRLLFAPATSSDGKALVVIKARPHPKGPPELPLQAAGYTPLLQIANLFVPTDALLEPPLRRDLLRKLLLGDDDDRLTWLEPAAAGAVGDFVVRSLPASALVPITEWIDYLVDRAADTLTPWIRGATFAFESFESTGTEWSNPPRARTADGEDEEPELPTRGAPKKKGRQKTAPAPSEEALSPTLVAAAPVEPAPAAELAPLAAELAALEQKFVALDAPIDDPERQPLWLQMARLNSRLGRRRDAGLCWTRALWEAPAADGAHARWAVAELAALPATPVGDPLTALLALTAPDRDQIRALAAITHAGGAGPREHAADITRWLDRFDDDLDLRSLWLARVALSRLVGGDALGLARARDRVLHKLHRGLSVERDVPAFLRFIGGGHQPGESPRIDHLVRTLDELRTRFTKTARTRSTVEAPPALTAAYVDLLFAYGLARLGQSDAARARRQHALTALDAHDPVHGFLSRAYSARIDHALDGQPPETPLPSEIAGELNQLERFLRYKVDRLRQVSTVLEPQERLDPMGAFHRGEADPRGPEFQSLRGETVAVKLAAEVARLFAQASQGPLDERARLYDGLMDFFPQLPESQALPQLETLLVTVDGIAGPRRAQLYEEALMLAGHFGRGDLVKQLLARLTPLLAELGPEHVGDAASTVGTSLRALRRVGLRQEAAGLLTALSAAATGPATTMVLARLHLAGGNFYLGHSDAAEPAVAEALQRLDGDLNMTERLQLVRGVARAITHASSERAETVLATLTRQLPRVTDSFNTNSHFCLSVVAFMESIILGYACDDLALGELGQRWLDEDEYLIRRRVHRDLLAAT